MNPSQNTIAATPAAAKNKKGGIYTYCTIYGCPNFFVVSHNYKGEKSKCTRCVNKRITELQRQCEEYTEACGGHGLRQDW